MKRLTIVLFLLASLPSTTAWFLVLADPSKCVHLRCEWRCETASLLDRLHQKNSVLGYVRIGYTVHSDDEPESSVLRRIQSKYPINTFTVVNKGKQCKGKNLWCNSAIHSAHYDYDAFLISFAPSDLRYQCIPSHEKTPLGPPDHF